MNQVPEKLSGFRVYRDGVDLIGIADAELPSIEPMKETVKGAGIAGEVESPVLGHFGSMTLKLSWRTVTNNMIRLSQQKAHHLDLRGSIQAFDTTAGAGEFKTVPLKVMVKAIPKKTDLGKFDTGGKMDSAAEFEVIYIKVWLNNNSVVEIDKYNYVCVIDGEDYLANIRAALGLL